MRLLQQSTYNYQYICLFSLTLDFYNNRSLVVVKQRHVYSLEYNGFESSPITKNTTAVFVVYILQIHLPQWFMPTTKTVLLRLQYYD